MGNFSDVPVEVMLDIFTRLPTESVLASECVCKSWRDVVRHESFAQMHSKILLSKLHSSAAVSDKLSFILKMDDLSEELPKKCYYLEYDDGVSSVRVKKMNFNPPFKSYILVGSCNGLICLKGLPKHYTLSDSSSASDVVYICNPITREVVTLPELDKKKCCHPVEFMLCGFGYVASTKEYKVVRMCTFKRDHNQAQIDVYTLGSGKGWRNAGTIPNSRGFIITQNAVFANGFLYWNFGNGRTAVYDLADEIFVGNSDFWFRRLWHEVLGGHLVCSKNLSEDNKTSDIWLLKRKEDESFAWCKEFSLTSTDSYNTPLAFTSSGTVLGYARAKLYLYDLKSASSKMLEDFGRGRTIFYAIPHMNTFVSLKAIGEENTTTLE